MNPRKQPAPGNDNGHKPSARSASLAAQYLRNLKRMSREQAREIYKFQIQHGKGL